MTGSILALSWEMVHDGLILRSEEVYGEITRSGTSAILLESVE